MWKATATLDQNALNASKQVKAEDDEWDSDPSFVNNISEKDQRWGKQKTINDNTPKDESSSMAEFREKVIQKAVEKSNENWKQQSENVKKSYMTPTNVK